MKAMLALEHDEAPPTLHADALNPDIDFAALNLEVATSPVPLPRAGRQALRRRQLLRIRRHERARHHRRSSARARGGGGLAARHDDFRTVGRRSARPGRRLYASQLDGASVRERAPNRRGDRPPARAHARTAGAPRAGARCVSLRLLQDSRSPERPIRAACRATRDRRATARSSSSSPATDRNGPAWAEPRTRRTPPFARRLRRSIRHFLPLAGWSLVEELESPELAKDLTHADIAQPMIFAIQAACVRALAAVGIRPGADAGAQRRRGRRRRGRRRPLAVGRDPGDLPSQPASGDDGEHRRNGCRLRTARDGGGAGRRAFPASRSPRTTRTAASPSPDRRRRWNGSWPCAPSAKLRARRLDLAYPFHSELMQPAEEAAHREARPD